MRKHSSRLHLLDNKLYTLSMIANCLNANGITWAVGGSTMLFLKGLVDSFHDIDLMVDEQQVEKAHLLLADMGHELPFKDNPAFQTRHFHEFIINDTEVDLIAGFVIVNGGQAYECPLLPADITESVVVNTTPIPLHSLSVWQRYYELMGRPKRQLRGENCE